MSHTKRKMIANYHTHTARCNHAFGMDEEYVLAAIRQGIKVLGFSDHMAWPPLRGEKQYIRMKTDQIEDYAESVRYLKEKYKDDITIYLGFEAEYFPDRADWLREAKETYHLDYYILGQHYHNYESNETYFGKYANRKTLVSDYLSDLKAAGESGLFLYYAHPDIYMARCKTVTEEMLEAVDTICEYSRKYNMPLEYNLQGMREKPFIKYYYPRDDFWERAARHKVDVIIGGDYHCPEVMEPDMCYSDAYEYLSGLGFHILDEMEMKNVREQR